MSLRYRLFYRLGITSWDSRHVSSELVALVDGPGALSAGRSLDIGCGTGTQAIYLAQHDWDVTGIDAVERALQVARRRADEAATTVRWLTADVANLSALALEPGFTLIHDRGCFHDLPDDTRETYVRGVTSLAAPGGTLMLMVFAPGRRIAAPSGADENEIRSRFAASWDVAWVQRDSGPDPPGPLKSVPCTWYRLQRR